jgi:hypothetical protein
VATREGGRKTVSNESRRQYRSTPSFRDDVRIFVVESDKRYPAELVNVSISGIGICLDTHPSTPLFKEGETMYLAISPPSETESIKEPCTVEHTALREEGRYYGVRFVDWMGLLERLPSNLYRLFNRRRSPRIEAEDEDEVQVYFETEGAAKVIAARLCDLAPEGIAFTVPARDGPHLKRASFVLTSFRLPKSEEHLSFRAELRPHTVEGNGSWRFGAHFDDSGANYQAKIHMLAEAIQQASRSPDTKEIQSLG